MRNGPENPDRPKNEAGAEDEGEVERPRLQDAPSRRGRQRFDPDGLAADGEARLAATRASVSWAMMRSSSAGIA